MTLHQPYTAGHGLEPQDAIVIAGPQRDGGIAQSEFSRETLQNSWVGHCTFGARSYDARPRLSTRAGRSNSMNGISKTPSFRLDGRTALVAGGTSGIGRGAASALAEFGADVTVAARSTAGLAETHDAMIKHGLVVRTMELDLANVEAIEREISEAGPFDILVNSAGIARHASAISVSAESF